MTTKIKGTEGVEFPDTSVQNTAGISQVNADTRYVNVAGDTMTGKLNFPSAGFGLGPGGLSFSSPITKYDIGDGTGYSFRFSRTGANAGLPMLQIFDNQAGNGCTARIIGNDIVGPPALSLFHASVQDWLITAPSDASIRIFPANSGTPIPNTGVYLSASPGAMWASLSDRRSKKDIEPLVGGLASVLALRPSMFRFIGQEDGVGKQVGFIAQDVQDVVPQAVSSIINDGEERLGLDMQRIIPHLVLAVQELSAKLDAALSRIAELEVK